MTGIAEATAVAPQEAALSAALRRRSIVLVGMMGAGKSSIGRRLAQRLGIRFVDADAEIEAGHAGMTIPEIFSTYGEPYFRSGEVRVIARLLDEGPQVLATGGGAYMNANTRAAIAEKGLSVWLKAEFEVLMKRVKRRATADRPMLQGDVALRIRHLMEERYPVYAAADITVMSRDVAHETIVNEIIAALAERLGTGATEATP
ncbi:MAG: shikimate kinase [Alphaproteobacteria bacterium]|nr:shikimate kinase [Alphaproteobacteria bacterium]